MIVRAPRRGAGWTITLADLALILFALTAAHRTTSAATSMPPATAVVQSRYEAVAGAPPLAEWLDAQDAEGPVRTSVVVAYERGGLDDALQQADTMARMAEAAGRDPDVTIRPGPAGAAVELSHDRTDGTGIAGHGFAN